MSTSSEIVDSGILSGQNTPARTPGKTSFSQTCNLFSQYLKENGSFPDLTLGMRVPPSTATMNLFPMVEIPRDAVQQPAATAGQKQQDQSKTMTMFYNGQVIVFNDLSPEKAKEIIKLAENGAPQKPQKLDEPLKNTVVNASDLPIARKASLARFLEKRKDRVDHGRSYPPHSSTPVLITARSPYQVQDVSKQDDSKSWLGLGAQ